MLFFVDISNLLSIQHTICAYMTQFKEQLVIYECIETNAKVY